MNTALKVWNAATELQKAIKEAENEGLEVILDTRWPPSGLLIDVEIQKAKEKRA